MTQKKNKFFTFCFSFLPGAAEMYMGFFKQGLSLMVLFFGLIAIASGLGLDAIVFIIPIVWFYSFFHAHNLSSMPEEDFYMLEDDYLFKYDELLWKEKITAEKSRKCMAIVLIIVGFMVLWNTCMSSLHSLLWRIQSLEWLVRLLNTLPRMAIAIFIIWLGIYLIKGKKVELEKKENENEMDYSVDEVAIMEEKDENA